MKSSVKAMSSPNFTTNSSEILQKTLETKTSIRVQGCPNSLQAKLLVALAKKLGSQNILVIAPDGDLVDTLQEDLTTLTSLKFENDADLELDVLTYPELEQNLYSSVTPSLRVRFARLRTLDRLQNISGPTVVLSTLPALLQKTISTSDFTSLTIPLQVGQSIGNREALARKLLDAGYLRNDPCEDPGTFSIRGDLIDVYPPALDQPIRILLFDDQVEELRPFDPQSQRTLKTEVLLTQLKIAPCREVPLFPRSISVLREQIKLFADETGVPRKLRDPLFEAIETGAYPDHSELLAPFAFTQPSRLTDYFKSPPFIVWLDDLSSLQKFEELEAMLEKEWKDFQSEQKALLPPPSAFFTDSALQIAALSKQTRLFFDQIQVVDLAALEEESDDLDPAADPARVSFKVKTGKFTSPESDPEKRLTFLKERLQEWQGKKFEIRFFASTGSQRDRLQFLLKDDAVDVHFELGNLSSGFIWPADKVAYLTEDEIFGTKKSHTSRPKNEKSKSAGSEWAGLKDLNDLEAGDLVVHVDHGIGRYIGLSRLTNEGQTQEYLLLEYAGQDKLYLPVYRMNVVQKYLGGSSTTPLDKLGSKNFENAKERVRESVKKLAIDLVKLYARRKLQKGLPFAADERILAEFESKFPFDETPDQLRAIRDCYADLQSGKVMDRLVCGDVGYGKTEVAIRAAFLAVMSGRQVAVLVPTTILCQQHENSFRARLKDYPINVESVSRFKSTKDQKETLARLAEGKVDIIIGTHRLLSKDIRFKNLGLLVIDEEHRFGVEHKEKLKAIKLNTHVLTLTATPIPRTLHMSLSGLRDISLITTPPVNRLPVRTYVSRQDDALMTRAVNFEISRGGQVFLVHNRVQSIYEMARRIQELAPHSKVSVGHAQMKEGELEKVMMAFYRKESNVLVTTTIIESGLDIPSANTILINRADTFGLAQLYQLRGRVGRSDQRGYAYLLIPNDQSLTEDAKKRLDVIQRFVELGSGFSVASYDLEIRGGGNLLGAEQSGHIAAVGFDLYTELLEAAVLEVRGEKSENDAHKEPEIKISYPCFIDEKYVPEVHQRLSLYRKLSSAANDSRISELEEEMQDRFGPAPVETQNLLWLIRLKNLLKAQGIEALVQGRQKIALSPGPQSKLEPRRAIDLVQRHPGVYSLTPDSKFVLRVAHRSMKELFFNLEAVLTKILGVANP